MATINNINDYNLKNWYYASQWAIFNRQLVDFLLQNEKDFNKIFSMSKFPDEFAYINYFKENEMDIHLSNKKTTFISSVPSLNKKYRSFPHTFDNNELDYNFLNKLKKSYLFLRKVVSTCLVKPKWIFYDIDNFRLDNSNVKLNKESYPNTILNSNTVIITNPKNTVKIKNSAKIKIKTKKI